MAEGGIHLVGSFQGWDPAATATGLKNSPRIKGKKNYLKIMSKLVQLNRGTLHDSDSSDICVENL